MGMTTPQLKEFVKCKRDPAHFIENYCLIQHPINGLVPFKLYDFQREILKSFQSHTFNITNKSRQTGLSTLSSGYALWLAIFHKQQTIIIISIKDDDAKDFLKKIKIAYEHIPLWMAEEPVKNNDHTLMLTSGSSIVSVASGSNAARGRTPSLLIIDEGAFIPTIEDIWTAAYPSLSRGGKAIVISTPNGIGNWFYETWSNADPNTISEKRNEFHRTFVHWTQIPEYRDFKSVKNMTHEQVVEKAKKGRWFKKMWPQFSSNPKRWAQEFEGDFLGSGNTLVDPDVLKETKDMMEEPKFTYNKFFQEDPQGQLWVWEKPKQGNYYVVSADVASGDGKDFCATQVLDLISGEQVAEYQGKMDTMAYARFLEKVARWYNTALLIPEVNSMGYGVVQKLVYEIGYENVFQTTNETTMRKKKNTYGWPTTAKTRPLLEQAVIQYFNSRDFKWRSSRLWNELSAFVWKNNGRAEADGSNNDDLVMAFAIGAHNRSNALNRMPLGIQYEIAEPSDGPIINGTKPGQIDEFGEVIIDKNANSDFIQDINNVVSSSNFIDEDKDMVEWLRS